LTGKRPVGKVIIIGATSGIGRELAKIFARKGYLVAASGRRNDLLLSLQQEFAENIITECFDVTGKENIVHLQNMISALGGADIIIYNSGFGEISDQLDWEIEKRTTNVNVNGFVEIICHAFNYFYQQGAGQIASVSSVASIRGGAMAPAYNASKAYQSNYLEGLYLKARRSKKNITVTDIQPGFVDTALAKGANKFWVATPQKAARQICEAIVQKRKKVYVTKRWRLVAMLLKHMPDLIYKRLS